VFDFLSIPARLALTLAMGVLCGLLFKRMKVPAGYMVGAFVGVAALNCVAAVAWVPHDTRAVVQIIAGAFVGCSMERSDLVRLRMIVGPVTVMLSACMALMLAAGFCIYLASPLDLVTSLMGAVPGGINDTPVVAADMGADAPAVTVLQLVRQVLGVAILPSVIAVFDKRYNSRGKSNAPFQNSTSNKERREKSAQRSPAATLAALASAAVAGLAGYATHIPGMTFAFAIVAVLLLKLILDFAYIPKWVKKCCQLLAGCYLGTLLTIEGLLNMGSVIIPITIVVAFYTANCFITGSIEQRLFGYERREGMLIASPAGASDMALIMDDMGIANTDVVIMQVIRAVVVMAVFPQVVNLVCLMAGG
jgi:membrane AbrB-like protein